MGCGAGELLSNESCDASHRWAGEGTHPYVHRGDLQLKNG